MSGYGWFRRQRTLAATDGASAAKRVWPQTKVSSVLKPLTTRGAVLTASTAALVLVAGIMIVAFASPGSHASQESAAASRGAAGPRQPAAALRVVSVTPVAGAQWVNGASPVRVQFSAPLSARSPMPVLSPAIAGQWSVQGTSAVFTPAVGYFQRTRVTVNIPGGAGGVVSAAGAHAGRGGTLAAGVTQSFTTGWFSTLRLQQLLAQLGYLPLTWTAAPVPGLSPGDARAELSAAYSPPAGTFQWQSGYPWSLTSQWKPGSGNMIQVGAVRAFESVEGLTMDGSAGSSVWWHLLTAAANGQRNPHGYTYALVSQSSPENLKIWHDGHLVLGTAVNTGIPASPTVDGTFPVYLRYYYQVMQGTNPDGSQYADPVWYVAYFNGGDAVHFFPRYSFGYYQSLGCVELPWDQARAAWPYLTYGSLVTVTGPVA